MARGLFLFLVLTLVLVGLGHGRPKKKSSSKSIGGSGQQGLSVAAMKTQLQNALNEIHTAPTILSILRSLPTLKQSICRRSSTSQPPVTQTAQAATTTTANEQDFGWLFDLVSTALNQTTVGKMISILKSDPKLRRELCGAGLSTTSTTPSTQTPSPVAATNPEVKTAAVGGSNFVDIAYRDEGQSGKRAMGARPTARTRPAASGQPATPNHLPATEEPLQDVSNDNEYSDEYLSVPAMRKQRSLASNDIQAEVTGSLDKDGPPEAGAIISAPNDVRKNDEAGPLEQERENRHDNDEQEFHIAAVIPTAVFPAEDVQAIPRMVISGSNLLEDGQFDETIVIYPESYDQAAAMDHKEQEQKKEETPLQDQKTLPSNAETLSQRTENSVLKQRDETKLEVTGSETEEEMKAEKLPLDDNSEANDVMVNKKEMFSGDEMPQEPPPFADENEKKEVGNENNHRAMTENKRNLEIPSEVMSNEVEDLRQEDWEVNKAPAEGEIKYEVDDDPTERLTKRKANKRLKLKLGKLRKKRIFA